MNAVLRYRHQYVPAPRMRTQDRRFHRVVFAQGLLSGTLHLGSVKGARRQLPPMRGRAQRQRIAPTVQVGSRKLLGQFLFPKCFLVAAKAMPSAPVGHVDAPSQ